ncbi:MAG: hypothetical protein IJ772_04815 [Bacilli bacterium]|nr:hypothetical protein [Bacilli bacterium]
MALVANYPYKSELGEQYQFTGKDPYAFSDDLNQKLKDENVTDIISNPGYQDLDITQEEHKQLLLFIRNFDDSGNLIESPSLAKKTFIDIYERKIERIYWYQPKTNENGSINIDENEFVEKFVIKEDPTIYIEDDIKQVNPHVIHDTTFISAFLKEYFAPYKELSGINNKSLSITIHNSTENYPFYDTTFNTELLSLFIKHNYFYLSFDLDKHAFEIDQNQVYEFGSFSLSNSKLILSAKPGFTIKTDNFLLDNVEIKVKTSATPYITVTYKETAKLNYISFTDKICYFDFSGKEDNITKWLSQSVTIFGLTIDTPSLNYDDVLEYIVKIKNTNTVTITGYTLRTAKFNMGVLRVDNCLKLIMNTCNFGSTERFLKSLVSIESVSSISTCGCYAAQDLPQKDKSYFFTITKGDNLASYSFVSLITTNFGMLSLIEDYSNKVSLCRCQSKGSIHPINYQSSSVQKICLTGCVIEDVEDFELRPNSISIFDSVINSKTLTMSSSDKIFVSNSKLKGKKSEIIATDKTNIFFELSSLTGDEIGFDGNMGDGIFKFKNTSLKSETINILGMNKCSVEKGTFETENFIVSGANISGFNPVFDGNKIKKIKVTGKISNSIFVINDKFSRRLEIEEEYLSGDISFAFTNKLFEINLLVQNSKAHSLFGSYGELDGESDISLTCKEDCTGSIIYTALDNFKIVPKAEGAFNDLKLIDSNLSYHEIRQSKEYNSKIAYGKVKA